MKLDQKGIPKELRLVGKREAKSTYFIYKIGDESMMMVSYMNKKTSRMKKVMILMTMHDKPQVHVIYDYKKGGIDIVDLLSTMLSTHAKFKRWPINTLAFLLDTARTKGKTILKDNGVVKSNFHFMHELGKALCLPSIKRRYHQRNAGLGLPILQMMKRVLGMEEANPSPPAAPTLVAPRNLATKKNVCCEKCLASIRGAGGFKDNHDNMNNKLKTKCKVCDTFLCKKQFSKKVEYYCTDHQDKAQCFLML